MVVDCANGAAYQVAPAVFEELGAKVIPLRVEPDGSNINDGCGALHPEAMAAAVRRHGAHLGLALDGDADRVIVADETGKVVDGDAIMAIVGRDLLRQRTLAKRTVVATVMSNLGLERALARAGGARGAHRGGRPLRGRGDAPPRATTSAASSPATSSSWTTSPPATAWRRR